MKNEYLVVYTNMEGEKYCSIKSAKQVCDMWEYSDLTDTHIHSVKVFKNGRFYKCCLYCGDCLDYESGSHNVYICKGKEPKINDYDIVNAIDCVYYSCDH